MAQLRFDGGRLKKPWVAAYSEGCGSRRRRVRSVSISPRTPVASEGCADMSSTTVVRQTTTVTSSGSASIVSVSLNTTFLTSISGILTIVEMVLGIIVFSLGYHYFLFGTPSGFYLTLVSFAYWLICLYFLLSGALSITGSLLPTTFFFSLPRVRIRAVHGWRDCSAGEGFKLLSRSCNGGSWFDCQCVPHRARRLPLQGTQVLGLALWVRDVVMVLRDASFYPQESASRRTEFSGCKGSRLE